MFSPNFFGMDDSCCDDEEGNRNSESAFTGDLHSKVSHAIKPGTRNTSIVESLGQKIVIFYLQLQQTH